MAYQPLHERLPKVAEEETRVITVLNSPDLPAGSYTLLEAYCNDPSCDCRRVFFNVLSLEKKEVVAVIAYGWGSREHYIAWFGEDNPQMIREMQGPILNRGSHQSELAPALLEKIKIILQDKKYVERLKHHYRMFRATIDDED